MDEWKDNAMWRCQMPQGKTERERQLELELEQVKTENLRHEVAKMNKEQEYWEQVRINAAMYAMQGQLANQVLTENMIESVENVANFPKVVANASVRFADALVAELKRSEDVYAECRRMDAINTASVCENMTKIQNELQKKGGQDENN